MASPPEVTFRGTRRKNYGSHWLTYGYFIIDHLKTYIERQLRAHVSQGMIVADVGCGEQPWKDLIVELGGKYIGIDLQQNTSQSVDIIADLSQRVNLPNGTVDAVLFTEVLEHLPDPEIALNEIARMLKPGGIVILTTPFLYRLHEEPHDYRRFTHYYVLSATRQRGFDLLDLQRSGNIIEVLATVWDDLWCSHDRPIGPLHRSWDILMRAVAHMPVMILRASQIPVPDCYYLSTMCVARKTIA